jgi:hypothetical protein
MESSIPVVPFGKYKGQPVTDLMADSKTLQWYMDTNYLQKYPQIYNICVNQTIQTNNNSKTPEHNKLQNKFLDDENVKKFIKHNYNLPKYVHKEILFDVKFEGKFNWDLIIEGIQYFLCKCNWDEKEEESSCDCEYSGTKGDKNAPNIYCELKPIVGDDYPAILRKMNNQIELTNVWLKKELNEAIKNEKRSEKKELIESVKINSYNCEYKSIYILLINTFNSEITSKDQLIQIFKQNNIKVIFTNEIFNDIIKNETKIESKEESIDDLKEIIKKLENKIKLLEDENLLLKNNKSNKNKNEI